MAKTSITAKLGLDTTAFQRGLAKSQKSISNFAKSGVAKIGALGATAGLGALARGALETAKEISNLSKVANASEEELQKIAFGANTVGVSMEKTADIMKDVSDKVGDFLQTGGGPLKDFFENIAPKVGVTAEQFRNLSGPQALQLYVSSLEKANISQNEMTFFMEAIASDATLLLPLLRNNGEAMKKFGDEAERTGQVMDKETIAKLKKANVELDQFKNKLTILAGKGIAAFTTFSERVGQGAAILAGYGDGMDAVFDDMPEKIDKATESQNKFSKAIEKTTEKVKSLKEQISEYYKDAKKAQDVERNAFVKGKELEVLKLRAKGEKKAADELENKIESMKKAIEIADKYGISLRKAANLVENINRAESKGGAPITSAAQPSTDSASDKKGIGSGFRSKFGPSPTFRERERAAGLYNTTLGRDGAAMDAKLSGAVAKPSGADPATTQKTMADDIKTIAKELTTTTR